MYETTVGVAADAASAKASYLRSHPLGYLVLSALAGAYVGFAVVLVFAIGAPLVAAGSPFAKLVMAVSFGVALSLVVFAGAELFTGNNLVMMVGVLRKTTSTPALAAVWLASFVGNFAGAICLAWLVAQSGVLGGAPQASVLEAAAATKMDLPFGTLFVRGMLCNWLVCLAVWSSWRAGSDAGKLLMIAWCLFAFVGAGFEHSVANMTLFGVALLQPHSDAVSLEGMMRNLAPVTLGNIAGGALFVGGAYWLASHPLGRIARLAQAPARKQTAGRAPAAARYGWTYVDGWKLAPVFERTSDTAMVRDVHREPRTAGRVGNRQDQAARRSRRTPLPQQQN